MIEKGATKNSTVKVPNQQYISSNYVKDFINIELNQKINSKANKIPNTSNFQMMQNKNVNSNNLINYNINVSNNNSGSLIKKSSGSLGNSNTASLNNNKIKISDKSILEKEKVINSNISNSVKNTKNDIIIKKSKN